MNNRQADNEGEILDLTREGAGELARMVEVSGFRFEGLVKPSINEEDGSIVIQDRAQANLLRDCVIHNAGLSEKLLTAHDVSLSRVREYGLPMPSALQLERIRNSRIVCQDRIELAKEIGTQISKLFDLEDHEYLKAEQ